jgi:hypothetical protein
MTLSLLNETLEVNFNRIYLKSNKLKEIITIDACLYFSNPAGKEQTKSVPGLAIIEIKKIGRFHSSMEYYLRKYRIRKLQISKYCLGISLTHPEAKSNNYKSVLKNIEKTLKP